MEKVPLRHLLTGKNRTFSGQIQINNVPIQEIKESSLMDKITLVRHNSYLFKGTVEENLKMADPSVSREQMEAALRQVNLYEVFAGTKWMDTMLEEQGSNFSGGQRQRLAIARGDRKAAAGFLSLTTAFSALDLRRMPHCAGHLPKRLPTRR